MREYESYKLGKNKLKYILLLVLSFVLFAIMPAHAADDDNIIMLKTVQLKKQSSGQLEVNLISNKKFPTTPLLFEKTKNTYFISLPATKYEGDRDVDVSSVKEDVSTVTVDFIPYKSAKNSGYTRIIIVTKQTMPIIIKESLNQLPQTTIILVIIISGIVILAIAYLAFALYTRLMKKKQANIALDEYQYTNDTDNIATDNEVEENVIESVSDDDNIMSEQIEQTDTIETEELTEEEETFEDIEAKVENEKAEILSDIFEKSSDKESINSLDTDIEEVKPVEYSLEDTEQEISQYAEQEEIIAPETLENNEEPQNIIIEDEFEQKSPIDISAISNELLQEED